MNPFRAWMRVITSLTGIPLLQAAAVAGAILMLVVLLIDVTVTEGRLVHEIFFSANQFPNIMFIGVSVIIGAFLLRLPRLQTDAGLTIRAIYIWGIGMVILIAALIAGKLLS